MKNTVRKLQALVFGAAILSITPAMVAQRAQQQPNSPQQTQTGAPMAQNSFCGNNALCYDAGDFAAIVTQFRTSTDGSGNKILDAILHFQNKTNQPIGLGYVDGSASGLDDRGNRYGLNVGWGGVRGMGVVSGNVANPTFVLNPGSSGDSRFEFIWVRPPANAVVGVNYEIEFDLREMNRAEANQWVMGNDTLMHYQGLVNGISVAGSSYNGNAAGAAGSSYTQGQAPANGGTMSNGYMAPVNNAVGGATNGVTNGYTNAVGGVTNGINNGVSGVTNGYSTPQGYSAPNGYAPNGNVPPSGYSQPVNGYAPNGYTAPATVTTSAPVNNTAVPATAKTITQSAVAKTAVTQPAAAKAAVPVTQKAQPAAVTKAVAIQPVPAAKLKAPVPPPPPAKKPSPANPVQH